MSKDYGIGEDVPDIRKKNGTPCKRCGAPGGKNGSVYMFWSKMAKGWVCTDWRACIRRMERRNPYK